jgi:hypothetical protein
VLSILRHLNYKPWFALAEFVDNAVQSYLVNRERLEAVHGPQFKLRVEIAIEPIAPARIVVRDNAAGIALRDFPRAFRCDPAGSIWSVRIRHGDEECRLLVRAKMVRADEGS